MSRLDRRHFLRLLALQAAAWSLSCGRKENAQVSRTPALPPNPHAGTWLGDDFTFGHRLRDGELPPLDGGEVQPECDVLVIGAGISGMTAALELARAGRRVVVIEQAGEPGGNSKAASWGGIEYAIGAAYFTRPDEGSRIDALYRELGVLARATKVSHGEVFSQGRLAPEFWAGGTAAGEAVAATKRVAAELHRVYDERYPDIPWSRETAGWTRAQFERADRTPFSEYLATLDLPPDVRMFCEYYCWSSFGASASEVSSYAGLNFLTAEFGEIYALPGGNAGIAQALAAALKRRAVPIHTGTGAVRVRRQANRIDVATLRGGGAEAATVVHFPARACVVAVPRFVAARILEDFPEARAAIVANMKWRAYVVANVLLAKRPSLAWYDAYRLEPLAAEDGRWTDLVLADFVASPRDPSRSVLTAYRALPFDAGRPMLFGAEFAVTRDAFRRDLQPWLGAIGLEDRDIVDINLARWGHPLVLARPGQLASGELERLSAPLGRIAFAHQDRYGVPAIENALGAAFAASDEVQRMDWVSRERVVAG